MTSRSELAAELANERTDLAEDRTLLANERTFSGWLRTAMASIGLAVGLQALFKPVQPTWAVKAIATVFLLVGMMLAIAAERRAGAVQVRLDAHRVLGQPTWMFKLVAGAVVLGAAGLIVAMWYLA